MQGVAMYPGLLANLTGFAAAGCWGNSPIRFCYLNAPPVHRWKPSHVIFSVSRNCRMAFRFSQWQWQYGKLVCPHR